MANHYYGIDLGGALAGTVSTGTVTTGKTVELTVVDGVTGRSKTELVIALDAIKARIQTGDAPA